MSLVVTQLQHTYSPGTPFAQDALRDLNLELAPGERVALIGHTGSGKSTLVQILAGLLKPSVGQVLLDGCEFSGGSEAAKTARRRVGLVFQYPEHQLFEETVSADIAFGPRNAGLPEEEVARRVSWAMKLVGLDEAEHGPCSPFQLSGGQMRRVALAGILALRPEYLILDEPSAGLDPKGRDEIYGQLLQLQAETGMGILLVTHNMEDAARLAQRLLVLDQGQLLLDGSPQQIFQEEGTLLKSCGLEPPGVTKLMGALTQAGLPIKASQAVTPKEAAQEIAAILRTQGGQVHVE